MFKKVTPTILPAKMITQSPHCDARVLHAPGECEYCDKHPEWQELRVMWGIAFTGYEPEGKELPDPATHNRPIEIVNAWGGNRASKS